MKRVKAAVSIGREVKDGIREVVAHFGLFLAGSVGWIWQQLNVDTPAWVNLSQIFGLGIILLRGIWLWVQIREKQNAMIDEINHKNQRDLMVKKEQEKELERTRQISKTLAEILKATDPDTLKDLVNRDKGKK